MFKVIRWVTYGAWATILAALALLPFVPDAIASAMSLERFAKLIAWVVLTAFAGSAFGMMYPGRRLSDRDWMSALRWKFWHGPVGRWLVKLAGIGGSARTHTTSVHRPTEIAIGLAAQDLYDSLPRAIQQRYRDLPRLIRRLEDEAQAIRTRIANLTSSLADESARDTRQSDGLARIVADLQHAREHAQARLGTVLAALEAIRLDLLRLSAGVGDPESLANAIAAARRIGDEVGVLAGPVRPITSPRAVRGHCAALRSLE